MNYYQKISKVAWVVFFTILYNVFILFFLVKFNFLFLFGGMPGLERMEDPDSEMASEVYSADNVLIGKYFRENRSPVGFQKINQHVTNALISTEDVRFYEHSGIDFKGFFAIFWYMAKGEQRGSSTITQQLAKNLFKTRGDENSGLVGYVPVLNTVVAKIKEWILSMYLEGHYTKNEILTMYLNTVDFGSNAFGIKVAAKTFFNTSPDSLSVTEAATLVGLLKAPTSYSPIRNPDNSMRRRNTVMALMVDNGKLLQIDYLNYKRKPLGLKYNVENHNQGIATYFRGELSKFMTKWCKENNRDLYADGLKIYTTIDSRMQAHAEEAVYAHMATLQKRFYQHWKGQTPWRDEKQKEIVNFLETSIKKTDAYKALAAKYGNKKDSIWIMLNKPKKMKVFTWDGEKDTMFSSIDSLRHYKYFLHAGMMIMDPYSGEIKSWVGGVNYKYFKYDHVKQGRRQPGSSFKPFVYTAAIESGMTPCDLVVDKDITLKFKDPRTGRDTTWTPHNADWSHLKDSITLRRAMARSINTIAVQLIDKVGVDKVINVARRMGIESELDSTPSLALGSSDVSVYEMTGAYSTFLNGGHYIEPYFISRIEDRNGNVLYEANPTHKDALTEDVAYVMLHMLKGGTEERGGTSQALFVYDIFRGNEIGGKTGTTSNYSDGWFMGVTTNLVGGMWVGAEDRSVHFRTSATGEGSKTALPMFGLFMEKVYADTSLNIKMGYFKRARRLSININCPYRPEPDDSLEVTEVDSLGVGLIDPNVIIVPDSTAVQ
jgi:penicillin-binding protein 1A